MFHGNVTDRKLQNLAKNIFINMLSQMTSPRCMKIIRLLLKFEFKIPPFINNNFCNIQIHPHKRKMMQPFTIFLVDSEIQIFRNFSSNSLSNRLFDFPAGYIFQSSSRVVCQ